MYAELIIAAGKSKYSLIFACFLLVYFLSAEFFKKEKVAVRGAIFVAVLLLAALVAVRLLPATKGEAYAGSVQVTGDGNGTAVGTGNCVQVDKGTEPLHGAKK